MRAIAVMHIGQAAGPPQHVRPWLAALAKQGSLEVIAPSSGSVRHVYAPFANVTVLPYAPAMIPRGRSALGFLPRLMRELSTFRSYFSRQRPDVVILVTAAVPAALVAARLLKIPTVTYAAEILERRWREQPLRALLGSLVLWLTARCSSAVVACSHTVARQYTRRSARVVTVYPGFDVEPYIGDRKRLRSLYGLQLADPCLAVVGNITPGRRQDLVIRAVAALKSELPGIACIIAGGTLGRASDAAYLDGLKDLAEELDVADRIVFSGFVHPVADVYAASDIVVNPACVPEALGRAALEALAAGRPVIVSRVGAIPEVFCDRRMALLVPPGRVDSIAAAVRQLHRDSGLRARLVQNGGDYVRDIFGEAQGAESFCAIVAAATGLEVGRSVNPLA